MASNPKKRTAKTKETMLIEPLPIFDCMYCVRDSKFVFQKLSEKTPTPIRLAITYQGTSTTIDYNSLSDDIKLMCEKYKTDE